MIWLDKPKITLDDQAAVNRALYRGHISTHTPPVAEFEKAIADYIGVDASQVVATCSGTAALHLALIDALDRKINIIDIPALSFAATRNVAKYWRFNLPRISPVRSDTFLFDFEHGITGEHAIIHVHLYGNVSAVPATKAKVIIDAAESFGAPLPAGSWDYICYSFNRNKTITCGGGGAIVCKGSTERIRKLIRPGACEDEPAYNYGMLGQCAALGLSQLQRIGELLAQRKHFAEIYRNELPVTFQAIADHHTHWFTVALFESAEARERIEAVLTANGIEHRRVFKPFVPGGVAQDIYDRGLCLPVSAWNTEGDIRTVCKVIRRHV